MQEETIIAAGAAETQPSPFFGTKKGEGGEAIAKGDPVATKLRWGEEEQPSGRISARSGDEAERGLQRRDEGFHSTPHPSPTVTPSPLETGGRHADDDKRARFREMVGGEFKEIYAEEVQRIIDRRFKKTKELEKRLAELEGAQGNETPAACPSSGFADGKTTFPPRGEGFDALVAALFENEQRDAAARRDAERLQRDVAALGEKYPDLDANALLASDAYLRAYLDGAPLEDLLWAQHHDALVQKAQQSVVENIRARGARPVENGAGGGATFTVHKDFSKMNLSELEAYGKKR